MEIGTRVKVYKTKTKEFMKESEVVEVDVERSRFRLLFDFYYYDLKTLRSYDNKTYVELPEDYKSNKIKIVNNKLDKLLNNLSIEELIAIQRIMNNSKSREGEKWD